MARLLQWGSVLAVLLLTVSRAQLDEGFEGEEAFDEEVQQDEPVQAERAKMSPENQRIILEQVSEECYEPIYAVVNSEAEQKDLDEQCNQELVTAFQKTPMGELQQKEMIVTQVAAILRVSSSCRKAIQESSKPPPEVEEGQEAPEPPAAPSESCMNDVQNQMRSMQQWVSSTTLSRLTDECKKEANTGNLGEECEAEFVSVKPGVLELLDNQNQQKHKEQAEADEKEAKRKEQRAARQNKPAPEKPWVNRGLVFVVFWTLLLAGVIGYTCQVYYKDEEKYRGANKKVDREEVDDATAHLTEKEKKKLQRKQDKKAQKEMRRMQRPGAAKAATADES